MAHYIDDIVIDCPRLGGTALGLSPEPDLTLSTPRIGRRHQLYGPAFAPADVELGPAITTGKEWTVAAHPLTALMEAIPQCYKIWEEVTGIRPATIAHRAYLTLRAARRLPAHRHLPHDQFITGVAFKLLQVHPAAASMTLRWLGLPVLLPTSPTVPLFIRGFSAGSYTGAAVSLVAPLISDGFHCVVQSGAIAMTIQHLCLTSGV